MLRNLFASAEQVVADQERKELQKQAGVIPILGARNRERDSFYGIIRSVVLRPQTGSPVLEVELYDGSGSLDLVWLGRREIAGVEPGARMRVTGLITFGQDRPTIFNPRYELQARTEQDR